MKGTHLHGLDQKRKAVKCFGSRSLPLLGFEQCSIQGLGRGQMKGTHLYGPVCLHQKEKAVKCLRSRSPPFPGFEDVEQYTIH